MKFILVRQEWFNFFKKPVIYHIYRLRKCHMVISIDAEKAFDKIHHPIKIKTLYKSGRVKKNLPKLDKGHLQNSL